MPSVRLDNDTDLGLNVCFNNNYDVKFGFYFRDWRN